ncbi:MAG: hypothetical protein O9274_13095 [Limnobacter sp.]|uniref:hypothetical protein n=1 Tax=Limnobacter sp. TaxID=2003368 RepID=UPI0022C12AFB|nr:hypothetical protein [Limnobacter sp.]MCZ8016632.1 hypothetical protein [Limnobacter sp.]
MPKAFIESFPNKQKLDSIVEEDSQSDEESEHSVQGSEHSVQVSEHSRSSNGRSAAGAFLKNAIRSISSSLSQTWKSTSPQPISNVELNQDLLPPQDSDAGAPGGSVETARQYILTPYGVDKLITVSANEFLWDVFGGDERELAGASKTPAGNALDVFFHACLWQEYSQGKDLRVVDVDALCFDLLSDTNRPDFQDPGLQTPFLADCANLYHAHGYQFPDQQIQQAIQKNVRLWTKANLVNWAPEKKQALKQQFLDQVSLDLNGRPSQATESVGLFSTPDEASVDFEDLGFDDLDSEASFAGMTVAHESSASERRHDIDFEGSEGLTRSASFDSISFDSSESLGPHISASRPADPFLSSDPGQVPANLLAFDTNPEMYSFWRLLSNTHGAVENLGQEEKNIASFNILLGHGSSVTSIPRLHQAFQYDRNALHHDLRRSGFDSDQIDIAITYHIQDWLNEQFNGPIDDGNVNPANQFSSLVKRCLKENEEGLDASTMYPILEVSSSSSQSGRSSRDDVESASSLSSNGWGDEMLYMSSPNNQSRLAELLPKANPARLIGSRSSEGSRLSELAKNFSWFAKPLSAPLRLRHAANYTPGVKVDVIEKDSAPPALAVKFNIGKERTRVNSEANLQLKAALNPHIFSQGDKSLNAMFLAQLDNSGIDKHLYHQAIRQGANQSAGGFRLSAQAHGGLMARTLPFMGPKKSLEQKAVSRLDGRGGKRLSALADHPKQFSKASDKAFLTYMASQQALWNKIKPHPLASDRLFVVPASNEPIQFNLLHQIGFAQNNLNADQLVQMGKLVMSGVRADVVRSPLSDADIRSLYQQDGMQEDQAMPLNVNQFRAALGPGRITRGGEKNYGTLGSQVIDLMARLNSKPGKPVSLKEHQMMGNLLTLMVKRQARLETPVAIRKADVSRQADPFKDTLIATFQQNLTGQLRGQEPQNILIRDDESMANVCEAATKAVNKAFVEIAKAKIVGNVPFLDKLKDVLRNDAGFYAAVDQGLADNIPNLTTKNRHAYLVSLMDYFANTAGELVARSVPMDNTNRAGQGGNRQSEIQPA